MQPSNPNRSLTLFTPNERTILGELTDASIREEARGDDTNYILSGLAGDGTLEALNSFMDSGADTVSYEYLDGGTRYTGDAFLLRPVHHSDRLVAEIQIESLGKPSSVA